MRVDVLSPPFAGHLFPLLEIGKGLEAAGHGVRVLTTHPGTEWARSAGLPFHRLMGGREQEIRAIADPGRRVGGNPMLLMAQFKANVLLMDQFKDELTRIWLRERPALVIADFTVPVSGVVSRELGMRWWTSTPSPCAIETRLGTPSFLGGWTPSEHLLGKTRDAVGRTITRFFKRLVGWRHHRDFLRLGIQGVYRADGLEAAYSPERILALGIREFEFERDWPEALTFVGYPGMVPDFASPRPRLRHASRNVLVTLGTHVGWAKDEAARLIAALAREMPDTVFHFSLGRPGETGVTDDGSNMISYDFIAYDRHVGAFDAVIHHGGSGITYACIQHAVPTLVWPHEYDQFDNASRIVANGIGLRMKSRIPQMAASLRELLTAPSIRRGCRVMQAHWERYDPVRSVQRLVDQTIDFGEIP